GLFAFVFVQIDAALHPAHSFFVEAAADDIARAQVFFDVEPKNLVENFVGWQRVLIFLVRLQFRARWFVDGRAWNDFSCTIYPTSELIDHRLRHITDDRETAGHVAVNCAITDGELALVVGSKNKMA